MQLIFIVNIESVLTYGYKLVVSVLGASTRNVQQHPSTFSTLNTFEHPVVVASVHTVFVLVVGIVHASPLHPYIIIGLVLHTMQLTPPPKAGLSQEFKQFSGHAFDCKTFITCNISAIQLLQLLQLLVLLLGLYYIYY